MQNFDHKRLAIAARATVAAERLQRIQSENAAHAMRTLAAEHASGIGVTIEVLLSRALKHERRTSRAA